MSIDTDTARRIARLARIRVEEAALPALAEELSSILGWVEQLQEVDVTGVAPMTSVTPMALPLRADAVTEPDRRDAILGQAPDAREGFYVVPKVVE
ncbi:MAG: Asp-tRNA(Asn)/Glu-tRNA(Gln) amidotransferase subunit GatC [Pikeienuella sp.]